MNTTHNKEMVTAPQSCDEVLQIIPTVIENVNDSAEEWEDVSEPSCTQPSELCSTRCVENSPKSILAPKASPSIPSRTSELTMLTDIRQKFNLLYPSEALLGLLIFVEEWVNICMKQTISEEIYFVITNKVLMDARLSEKQVGCNVSEHKTSLTAKVTHFFTL
ncbi:hypothetical protein CHUAL_009762 [Chamberlinius hualienensis]